MASAGTAADHLLLRRGSTAREYTTSLQSTCYPEVDELPLQKHNLMYREDSRLLMCCVCKCVLGRSFAVHAKSKHNITIKAVDRKVILEKCFAQESPYASGSQQPLPALNFLPIQDGYRCTECNHYWASERHAREHAKKKHQIGNEAIVRCKVQTLSSAIASCITYFGVQTAESTHHPAAPPIPSMASIVQKTMELASAKATVPVSDNIRDNIREANLFYVIMGWWHPTPTAANNTETISSLFHVPVEGEDLYCMATQIFNLICNSLESVSSFGFQLRVNVNVRLKGSRGPDRVVSPLTTLESDHSRKEYGRLLTSVVFFAHNYNQHHPELMDQQTVVCLERLFQSCTKCSLYGLIGALLQEYTPTNSESKATIPLFIQLHCHLRDGSLMSLDGVSRTCAMLIYLAKVSVLELVMLRDERSRRAAMDELKPLVEIDNYNIFSYICRVQGLARRVFATSNRIPCILSRMDALDPWKIVVGGVTLSAQHLRSAYREALSRCHVIMERLLMGVEPVSSSTVFDGLSGSCTVMSDRDPALDRARRYSLLKHVLETPELRARFVTGINSDVVQYAAGEAQLYLDLFDEYMDNMLLVVHLVSGMPARATEMETYRLVGTTSSRRSVYYVDGMVFLMSEYSKTRSLMQANRTIARFLSREATSVLLNDLSIIRPFACSLATFLGRNQDGCYSTHLFVSRGAKVDAPLLRNTFSRLFHRHTEVSITFQEYRHVAKYMANELNIIFNQYDEGDYEDDRGEDHEEAGTLISNWEAAQTEQFGHSAITSNLWYAMSCGEMSTMRRHLLDNHRRVSLTWHQFLRGEVPITRKRTAETSGSLPDKVVKVANDGSDGNPAIRHPVTSSNHDAEQGTLNVQCTVENASTCVVASNRCSTQHSFVTVEQSRLSVQYLQEFFKNTHASLKSAMQQAAVDNVLFTNSDLIAIMPTGGGKSLLFFLYAVKNPHKSSILIVPTIALKKDMKRRAHEHGVTCTDNLETAKDESLVVITPEGAESSRLRTFIVHLHASNRLGSVFIDEAHIFSTECDFRPCVRRLPEMAFLPNLRFVLLTATAPQWILDDIQNNLLGPNRKALVIRESTNRLNIKYEINSCCNRLESVVTLLMRLLQGYNDQDRCIVYVPALDLCGIVKTALEKVGIPCAVYSGQEEHSDNEANLKTWSDGHTKVMIATSAFGLGIDYASVRTVLCYGLPYSMEEFVQQTGRSGRDGKPSFAYLYFDRKREEHKLDNITGQNSRSAFQNVLRFSTTPDVCIRRMLSRYFDQAEIECNYVRCETCSTCSAHSLMRNVQTDAPVAAQDDHDYFGGMEEEIFVDCNFGQDVVNSHKHLAQELWFLLTKFSKNCIVCYVAKGISVCHPKTCNTMYNLCYRCLSDGHKSSQCPHPPRRIHGACALCFLPATLGGTIFHPNGLAKDCAYKDILKFFGAAVLRFGKVKDAEWLYSYDINGILNIWTFFVKYCASNTR